MSQFATVGAWIEERLPALLAEHHVPAASVGLLYQGEVFTFASGVLNKNTRVEADTDSVFQIGSITKVWTTSLIMQLVDEGKLDIDARVRDVVPEFVIADDASADIITVRMLLSHVAGFEGDFFTDTGAGDDCVAKYLETLSDVPQLFAPGEQFSYNNAAFVVLGRIIEVLRGTTYNQALREHLATPLGLTHLSTGPSEAIMHRAALGHIPTEGSDEPVPAPVWNLAYSNAPAGAMLAMTARDLLAFAKMHIDGGTAADGTRVLSAESVAAMQTPQVTLPNLGLMGDQWGLGWELFNWDGGKVVGHDGGTIGQNAFLRIAPGSGLALTLLTNGGATISLYQTLFTHVFAELAGITVPSLPSPADASGAVNLDYVLGTYSSSVADSVVRQDDEGRVWLEQTMKGIFATLGPAPEPVELVAWQGDTLLPKESKSGMYMPHAFVGDDGTGKAAYLHTGRADRRIA